MSLEHLQGDYAVEVLMSSVYVSIYLSKNNFSCRRLASESFFLLLVFLGERRELSSVTLKTFYYLGLVTGST